MEDLLFRALRVDCISNCCENAEQSIICGLYKEVCFRSCKLATSKFLFSYFHIFIYIIPYPAFSSLHIVIHFNQTVSSSLAYNACGDAYFVI